MRHCSPVRDIQPLQLFPHLRRPIRNTVAVVSEAHPFQVTLSLARACCEEQANGNVQNYDDGGTTGGGQPGAAGQAERPGFFDELLVGYGAASFELPRARARAPIACPPPPPASPGLSAPSRGVPSGRRVAAARAACCRAQVRQASDIVLFDFATRAPLVSIISGVAAALCCIRSEVGPGRAGLRSGVGVGALPPLALPLHDLVRLHLRRARRATSRRAAARRAARQRRRRRRQSGRRRVRTGPRRSAVGRAAAPRARLEGAGRAGARGERARGSCAADAPRGDRRAGRPRELARRARASDGAVARPVVCACEADRRSVSATNVLSVPCHRVCVASLHKSRVCEREPVSLQVYGYIRSD